jgi:hypothetical protein
MVCDCLSAAQFQICRAHGTCGQENATIALQHYECLILVGKPCESFKCDTTVTTDNDKPLKSVPYSRQSKLAAIWSDAVLNFEMA